MNRGLKLVLFVLLPAAVLGGAFWRFGMPTEALLPAETAAVPAAPAPPATVAAAPPAAPAAPAAPAEPAPTPTPPPPAAAPSAPTPPAAVAAPAPPEPAPTLSLLAPPPMPAPPLMPAKQPDPEPPAFDLVRVEPDGSVVVAGRSSGNASVTLLRNGEPWDRATANATGQFAMTPKPLPSGTHELSLSASLPDGRSAGSVQIVTVDVPIVRGGDVVVALVAPDRPTQVLSPPKPVAPGPTVGMTGKTDAPAPPPEQRRNVEIATVEQEVGGTFFAAGTAHPGATVRLYVNDSYLATAIAGPDGRWSFSVGKGLTEGSYRVRLDDVRNTDGKVLSRAEVPFEFASRPPLQGSLAKTTDAATVVVPEVKTTTVARGDSLWRISQRVYGNGRRYIVIHRANEEQIRNPDLIYPGQVFVLPAEKAD